VQGIFLILNFRHVVSVGFFLLGDTLVSKFYVPTFWNTVFSIIKGHVNKKNKWDKIA
jgi:hypothetical protein